MSASLNRIPGCSDFDSGARRQPPPAGRFGSSMLIATFGFMSPDRCSRDRTANRTILAPPRSTASEAVGGPVVLGVLMAHFMDDRAKHVTDPSEYLQSNLFSPLRRASSEINSSDFS